MIIKKDKAKNTEQDILEAAESEFLSKGFVGAKTTEIARLAGVNHAMLHYYFRTKENLFDRIFKNKINVMVKSVFEVMNADLPFLEKLEHGIRKHFEFIVKNPQLPFFLLNELLRNEKLSYWRTNYFLPNISSLLDRMDILIQQEVKNGTIKYIHPIDLITNIVSLNVFVVCFQPIMEGLTEKYGFSYEEYIARRCDENVMLIIGRLKK